MEFHKISKKKRTTYPYSHFNCETERVEEIVICPSKDGAAEINIKSLYSSDDSEVYNNIIKNNRPKLSNEERVDINQQLVFVKQQNQSLQCTVAVQQQQISEMKPKASYYNVVLNCKDLVAISTISKDYGWSAIKMNSYLHEKGVQFKQGGIWLLYQKHANQGYTSTKTHSYNGNDGTIHTKLHTYWTQKGRLFIYSLLKLNGIVPLVEQEA